MRWRRPVAAAAGTAIFVVAGCSLIRGPEPPAADLSGTFAGVLRIEGDEIPATLRVDQDGGRVDVTLRSDVGLDADGRGRLEGTVFRARLGYGEECGGKLELAGQALDDGDRLVGTVEVEDCTGPAHGSFSLSRR